MKQKLAVNPKGSGIKTTKVCAKIFKTIGIISFVLSGIGFVCFIVHNGDDLLY